jgi:gamma-glutamyltranspeptidase/glutathione hydrolase
VFGMSLQKAVEAPRFVTHSVPGSFEPHPYFPGRLDLDAGILYGGADPRRAARAMGW